MDNKAVNGGRPTVGLLTGWKAIAQHFGRTQSTVRRWAATAGMPVYRAAGEKGLSVYAYVDELDAWLTQRHEDKAAVKEQTPALPCEDEAAPAPEPHQPLPDHCGSAGLYWRYCW